jgi:hypothetical protein
MKSESFRGNEGKNRGDELGLLHFYWERVDKGRKSKRRENIKAGR